jgi:plastocyanin
MSPAKRYLPLAALLGVALAAIPGLAHSESSPPATASFVASDSAGGYYGEGHHWYVSGGSSTQVTVAQGATVTFSYPGGKSQHNVDFGGGAAPGVCAQTAGSSSGAVPPLPHEPTKSGWSGSCTFNTPGIYDFHCDEHPTEMKGTIVVQAASQPPATTPTTGTSGAPPPSGSGEVANGQANSLTGNAVQLAASQRGTSVHGSVQVAQNGSTLEVNASAASAQLAAAHHHIQVRVGRFVRSSLAAGRVSFALHLDATARRALRRQRRLPLIVRIVLTVPDGSHITRTLAVLLHRP